MVENLVIFPDRNLSLKKFEIAIRVYFWPSDVAPASGHSVFDLCFHRAV